MAGTRQRPPLRILLAGCVVALLALLPLVYLVVRAAETGPAIVDILLNPRSLSILLNSLGLAAAVTVSAVLIGVTLAWLTVRTDLPGRNLWSVITALPLVLPSYVGAFALVGALGPRGMLQDLLEPLGVGRLPSIYGFPGAWLTLTLFSYPYVLLTVRASLRGLDPTLEDAARSLGRKPRQVFYQIIVPHLRPAIHAGALLVALYTLSDFGAVSMLQFDSFTRVIFLRYTASLNLSAASALALMLVALTLVLLGLESHFRGRKKYFRVATGAPRAAPRHALGAWRWPAFALCVLIASLSLLLPVGVIAWWLVRGWHSGQSVWGTSDIIWNSLHASLWAAAVTAVVAIPVAWLVVRYPGRLSRWIERAAYAGHALPGLVIALALVFWGARYVPVLYQTLAMLVFAYTCRFLPEAIGSIRSSLQHISPRLEEAARNLGKRPGEVFRTVTLPLLRPGLLTGFALVFMTSMKELPATLLLAPTGFSTLATRIWSATEETFYARAAAPALVLVVVSAIFVGIILAQEEKELYE